MRVGEAILDLAGAADTAALFVVGTGKNAGKTVTARAVYEAMGRRGRCSGMLSIGRDGEANDAMDARPKPRLFLRPGTVLATARDLLPASPASVVLATSSLETAAGMLLYARVATGAYYELVGPPTASGVREALDAVQPHCDAVIVDGAIDRVAAVAGGRGAIVVAVGAAAHATMDEAVEAARALVRRLSIEPADPTLPALAIDGALTASRASALIAARESRQVVVGDPTQVVLGGAAVHVFERLRIRCERPLTPVAATVAPLSAERSFDPAAFATAVAAATRLPTFDVFSGRCAA